MDFDAFTRKMSESGEFFTMPNVFFKHMSTSESVALAEIINQRRRCKDRLVNDEWFEYTTAWMIERLDYTEAVQQRIITRLIEMGFIEACRIGMPSTRHFKVNHETIHQKVYECSSSLDSGTPSSLDSAELDPKELQSKTPSKDGDKTPSKDGVYYIKKGIKKDNTVSVSETADTASDFVDSSAEDNSTEDEDRPYRTKGGFFPEEESEAGKNSATKFDMTCAAKLCDAVLSHHKNDRKGELGKWATQFRLLRNKDGVPKDLIRKVLEWYVHADWSDPYLPQAWSGKSFREKFYDKLVPAMERAKPEEEDEYIRPVQHKEEDHIRREADLIDQEIGVCGLPEVFYAHQEKMKAFEVAEVLPAGVMSADQYRALLAQEEPSLDDED